MATNLLLSDSTTDRQRELCGEILQNQKSLPNKIILRLRDETAAGDPLLGMNGLISDVVQRLSKDDADMRTSLEESTRKSSTVKFSKALRNRLSTRGEEHDAATWAEARPDGLSKDTLRALFDLTSSYTKLDIREIARKVLGNACWIPRNLLEEIYYRESTCNERDVVSNNMLKYELLKHEEAVSLIFDADVGDKDFETLCQFWL
ncbi:hypothetical protein F5Y13DRAFT_193739 [Hypoxylon sp. FL1857]|nr:hypothetical protein F5Y13DRAFT_193739 [Hypoxylon sp. FL1857]